MQFQVVQLMMIDCKHASSLFIQHRDIIPPPEVVSKLIAAKDKCDSRYFLHHYLHSLFEANPDVGRDYHDMQVCYDLIRESSNKMIAPESCGLGIYGLTNSRFNTSLVASC